MNTEVYLLVLFFGVIIYLIVFSYIIISNKTEINNRTFGAEQISNNNDFPEWKVVYGPVRNEDT